MGVIYLRPIFSFTLLLLPSFCYSQSPDSTLLELPTVTVYDCPTVSDGVDTGFDDVFSGDESPFIAGSPVVLNSMAPPAVLLPAVHSSVDQYDYDNFVPQQKVTLYYEQPSPDNNTTTTTTTTTTSKHLNLSLYKLRIALTRLRWWCSKCIC
jgi:hypothetical protein